MDFTAAYRHASAPCITYSPGSTFLSSITGQKPRTLLVRASSTLQVIRSWDFDTDIDMIEWSRDGSFIMAATLSKDEDGIVYIVSLDPEKEANDGTDGNQGWVARIATGSEGLQSATWTPPVGPRTIILFSQNQLRASLYSFPDQTISAVEGPKRNKIIWSPKRPNNFAMMLKGADRDHLHIYDCARVTADMLRQSAYVLKSDEKWQFERSFALATNDAADASWSPDGLFIAVWEGQLEYKLLIYTSLGRLRSIFIVDPQLDGDPTTKAPHLEASSPAPPPHPSAALSQSVLRSSSVGSSTSKKKKDDKETVSAVAGGGLGIREVVWHPTGRFIAIGGYDEKLKILENQEWTECVAFDLSKRTIGGSLEETSSVYGPMRAWREPLNWFEETRARGIVGFETASLPIAPAALRVDTGKANPKVGVSWTQWSPDGNLIASFNERLPFTLFIHFFQDTLTSATPQPYLLSILQLNLPIRKVAWKPGHAGKLAVVCESQAIYTWELLDPPSDDASFGQRAEATPIPTDDFRAIDVRWSLDGHKVLIASEDTFCCAFENVDDSPAPDTSDSYDLSANGFSR